MKKETKKIVIAEDDGFLAEIYFTKLSFEGFQVTIAADGEEAITKVKEHKPDLLLLDIMMPKKNGIEVLETLRSNPETKDLPVLVLTNAGEKENVTKAMDMGAKDYLIKSYFTPEEVVSKVKEALA